MKHSLRSLLANTLLIAALAMPVCAYAYIDPGAGVTSIRTVAIIAGVILLALVGLLWYPLKRLLTKKQDKGGDSSN